jgi:Fe-S-cluster-containing dehydrogenase component
LPWRYLSRVGKKDHLTLLSLEKTASSPSPWMGGGKACTSRKIKYSIKLESSVSFEYLGRKNKVTRMKISRRTLLLGGTAAGALALIPAHRAEAEVSPTSYATLIDLTKCDGCQGRENQLCVNACRTARQNDFPRPAADQLLDYWPQKKHEDWSNKKEIQDRLTPYNWLFVQTVKTDGEVVHIPRRCMHCDNPPCAKLCPFGIKHKTKEGPVYIDHSLCFGGAKCRSVCPWSIPQRQAGVGIYTLWQKYLPVGGGVMYKCDLCRQELQQGKPPHCIAACPRQAMAIGTKEAITAKAEQLKKAYGGDIYGQVENGGTATLYVSKIPFTIIDAAIEKQAAKAPGSPLPRMGEVDNVLERQSALAWLGLASPVLGVVLAMGLSGRKAEEDQDGK